MSHILPTGTVTFLFTDIEGSTALAHQYPGAMPALLARHHAILHQAIARQRGHVFLIVGDSFQAAFFTPAEALAAALDAQFLFGQEPWFPAPLHVRMGIHTGAAQADAGEAMAGGYAGYATLARVQRVMSSAYGEQILVSNASAELLRGELPAGVTLQELGEHHLKGLSEPERLWQVLAPDLRRDFPPLATQITTPNNLPLALTSFVGRAAEIAQVKQLLATTRLLTLTGMGGTGKTRLSLQVAPEVAEEYADGIWQIELAPLSEPALIPQKIASVFGLRDESGRPPIETLIEYFHSKTLLLVLDNCEHLIPDIAQVAAALLSGSRTLKLLATSREALGIAGELVWSVPPLQLPAAHQLPSLDELNQIEAIRLFLDRVLSVQPNFTLTDKNAPYVLQICQRLDGIPLAIELAAARIKGLSAQEIANHLDDRFRLLTGGSRNVLPHHQTLRSTLDWSHQLLDEPERTLFRRLAVFAGGWTLPAAEAICSGDDIAPAAVLDLQLRLVDKSLVVADQANETTRYHFLETVRQYAREKLSDATEIEFMRQRHLVWFLALAQAIQTGARGGGSDTLARLDGEHDNFRLALQWAIESNNAAAALQFGEHLWVYWDHRGFFAEGLESMRQILQMPGTSDKALALLRAQVLLGAALIYSRPDEHLKARALAQEALGIARHMRDRGNVARALRIVGTEDFKLGKIDLALHECREGLELARKLPDQVELGQSLLALGAVETLVTELGAARTHYEQALALFRSAENNVLAADALAALGEIAYLEGSYAVARELLQSALSLARARQNRHSAQIALRWLAHVDRAEGDLSAAMDHASQELEWVRERGDRLCTAYLCLILGWTAAGRGDLASAEEFCRESYMLCAQVGSPPRLALAQVRLGNVVLARHGPAGAEAHFRAGLAWCLTNGARALVTENLEGFAHIALALAKPERAATLFSAAATARRQLHLPLAPVDQPLLTRDSLDLQSRLDESALLRAKALGQAMSLNQAAAFALN